MADDDIKIDIPPPDTKKAKKNIERFIDVLEKLEKKLVSVDKVAKKTKLTAKKGGGGPLLGSGPSGKNPGKGFLGGGTSGGIANISRAAGVGGPAAVALGQASPAASILIGLVAGFKDAITKAAEFQTALTEIGRVSGLVGKDLKQFGENVSQLSTEIPVATKQIFQLASAGANAGLNAGQLKAFTYQMSKLAVILPSLSDEQVRGIIRIAALTDFPIDRIEDLNGALLNLQQRTKATLPQLIQLGQRVAQDVGIFGASTKEVAGLAATIADLALPPERASTSIGRLTGKLKNLSSLGPKAIKKITNTFYDQEKAIGFVELAMDKPIEAMQLLAQQSSDAGAALDAIGISSGSKAGNILLNLLKRGDRWLEIQKEAKLNGGLVDDQAALVMKDLNSQWVIFKNTLDDISQSFGEKLSPYLTDLLKTMTLTVKAMGEISSLMHSIEPPGWLAELIDVSNPFLITADLVGDGIDFLKDKNHTVFEDKDIARGKAIEKMVGLIGGQIEALQAEGKRLLILDPFENEIAIRKIDAQIVAFQGTMNTMLESIKASGGDTAAVMKKFQTSLSEAGGTAGIRQGEEALKRLAARATKAQEAVSRLREKTSDLEFDIKIFDLTKERQSLEKIIRSTDKEIGKNLGGTILNKTQVDDFRDEVFDLTKKLQGHGIEIALRDGDGNLFSAKTLSERIAKLRKSEAFGPGGDLRESSAPRQIEKLYNLLNLLGSSKNVAEGLKNKEGLTLEILRKEVARDTAKEREAELKRIAGTKAPGLNLVDSVGKGVEVLNQQILDTNVQEDMLNQLEIQNEKFDALIEATKRNSLTRNKIATYAGSQ